MDRRFLGQRCRVPTAKGVFRLLSLNRNIIHSDTVSDSDQSRVCSLSSRNLRRVHHSQRAPDRPEHLRRHGMPGIDDQ